MWHSKHDMTNSQQGHFIWKWQKTWLKLAYTITRSHTPNWEGFTDSQNWQSQEYIRFRSDWTQVLKQHHLQFPSLISDTHTRRIPTACSLHLHTLFCTSFSASLFPPSLPFSGGRACVYAHTRIHGHFFTHTLSLSFKNSHVKSLPSHFLCPSVCFPTSDVASSLLSFLLFFSFFSS